MPIRCRCTACEAQFRIDDKYAGKKARCPKCSQIVIVPQSQTEEDVATFPTLDSPPPTVNSATEEEVGTFPVADSPKAPPRKPPAPAEPRPTVSDPTTNTVDLPAGFPLIDTASDSAPRNSVQQPTAGSSAVMTKSGATSPQGKLVGRGKKKSPLPIILGASCAGLVLIVAVIIVVVSLSGKDEQEVASADDAKSTDAVLVYEWPVNQRKYASLAIDGDEKRLPTTGPLEFHIKPGKHSILIKRRGYEPITESLTLETGEKRQYRPAWVAVPGGQVLTDNSGTGTSSAKPLMSLPGYDGWWQNLDKAKDVARQEKKDLLIAFVGSDWDRESQILRQEVFASLGFQTIAERYVRVVIDSPRTAAGYNQLADSAQNNWVKQDYGVVESRIPLVVLADEDGRPYVVQGGYDDKGGQNYLAKLSTLHNEKAGRDTLFAKVKAANGEAKLDAALQASEWIGKNYVASFFNDEIKQWLTLAEQFDADNAKGKYEAIFELQWMTRLIKANIEDDARAAQSTVAELGNWVKTRKLRDPNRGARMHLLAGMTSAETPAELQRHIEDALAYNPNDPELKEALASLKEYTQQAASRVLGTGSGFVVGNDGYVMTNFHVIEEGIPYVVLPGAEDGIRAKVLARDTERDLALIKIDLPEGMSLKPLDVSTNALGRGIEVAAYGFPLAGESLKATFGRVSGLPSPSSEGMYVLDCIVNPGNSGGPLCDKRGTVVGIVTAKTNNVQAGVDSYGMAVPADDVKKFLTKHLPDYKPTEAAESPPFEGWDKVDPLVSPSVLMIQIKAG